MRDKRERIIESAVYLFLDNGYEKTTIQEIALKASVGKGTVYEYFSSKEELQFECIRSMFVFYNTGFEEIMTSDKTFKDKLFCYMEYTKKLALQVRHPINLVNSANTSKTEEIKNIAFEFRAKIAKTLEDAIKTAIENGEIRNDIHISAITYFILVSVMQLVLEFNREKILAFDVDDIFTLIYNGIGA